MDVIVLGQDTVRVPLAGRGRLPCLAGWPRRLLPVRIPLVFLVLVILGALGSPPSPAEENASTSAVVAGRVVPSGERSLERGPASVRLRVGGDHDYPPYEFVQDGQPTGFNIELIQAVAEVMDLRLEIQLGPWRQMRTALERGHLDVLAGMYYSKERDQTLDFCVPNVLVSPGLFVRNDSPIRSFESLRGKEVIVQDGDVMHDLLERQGFVSHIVAVQDSAEALRLLASGKHDAALLSSKVQGLYLAHRFELTNLTVVSTGLPARRCGFAVHEGNPALVQQLNEGLNILRATGKYREIYDKWFGVYESPAFAMPRSLRVALILIAAASAASILWSWSLRRQVRIRTAELHTSEERFRVLIEQAPEAILVHDVDQGRFIEANRNAERLFGCPREELLRSGPQRFYSSNQPDGLPVDRSMQDHAERALAGEELTFERVIHPLQGGVVYCDVRLVRLPSTERRLLRASYIDITERKRADEELRRHRDHLEELVQERTAELARANQTLAQRSTQLRALANQLIEAEQRERRRIAYVLHENFQQLLAAAKFSIQLFRDKGHAHAAQQALESLDQAIAVSRSLTIELRPPVLYELGLGPALEWLGRQAFEKYNLTIQLQVDRDADPGSDNLRSFLFEAVRELLLNVAKHAKVDTARVTLSRVDDQIQLQIADHGAGFDMSQTQSSSFGLFSIRERIELLGGRVEVDSVVSCK